MVSIIRIVRDEEKSVSQELSKAAVGGKNAPAARTVKVLGIAVTVISLLMFLYHMLSSRFLLVNYTLHQNYHLGFALVIVFLAAARDTRRTWVRYVYLLLTAASIIVTIYIYARFDHLQLATGFPDPIDMGIGIILALVVLVGTWRSWGAIFSTLAILFILYAFFGHLIPRPFGHSPLRPELVISYLGIGFQGTFGPILSASALYIFLFVVFGSLFEISRANDFFWEVGKVLGRYLPGGGGIIAVIASLLVGMTTGAAAANVAITGSFTIPMMKRQGFRPEVAGAVEASASTGGQIMPPVMGASAFIMATMLGVAYVDIMVAALIPALFYFAAVFASVVLYGAKHRIRAHGEKVNMGNIYRLGPLFLIPLAVMIYLLLKRYTLPFAGFWTIITLLALCCIQKRTRPSPGALVRALSHGAMQGAQIGLSCACIGIVASILTLTGLGQTIASVVVTVAGANVYLALLMTMAVSMVLGCGVPTVAAYVIVAIVVAPALIKIGMFALSAHMFAFYFAILAVITPPMAPGPMVASAIAGSRFLPTCWEAIKLAFPSFLFPFFLLYHTSFLLKGAIVPDLPYWLCAIIVVCSFACMSQRYFLVTGPNKLLYAVAAVSFTSGTLAELSLFFPPMSMVILSIASFSVLVILAYVRGRRIRSLATGAP